MKAGGVRDAFAELSKWATDDAEPIIRQHVNDGMTYLFPPTSERG
jgi:hypothetical protein